jgi:hypothetical protein
METAIPDLPLDAFALEELRWGYRFANANQRVQLLKDLADDTPFEIAKMAAEDPSAKVRAWFARNAKLDYRGWSPEVGFDPPDANLADGLINDPDTFVRASVYANPRSWLTWGFSGEWEGSRVQAFWKASTMVDRAAMLRNPEWWERARLLMRVVDLSDEELALSLEQRKELLLGFLKVHIDGASGVIRKEVREALVDYDLPIGDYVWERVSKWPKETAVHHLVYRYLPAQDETVASIFRGCKEPELRRAMLCMVWDEFESRSLWGSYPYWESRYTSTLEAGTKDEDGACRLLAYAMVSFGRGDRRVARRIEFWKVWRVARNDVYALSGLAKNLSLAPGRLRWVRSRAHTLAQSRSKSLKWDELKLLQVDRDIERTIGERRFERWLARATSYWGTEPKVEWSESEKVDYLTQLSLSNLMWWAFAQVVGIASVVGLAIGVVTFLVWGSMPLSLLLFFGCCWLGGLFVYRTVQKTIPAPPWRGRKEWETHTNRLWSTRPRRAPLVRVEDDNGEPT